MTPLARSQDRTPSGYRLELRPDPVLTPTLRAFATAVGRDLGLAEERVEDLKLVLSEIWAGAVAAEGGGSVAFRVDTSETGIRVDCEAAGPPPAGGGDDAMRDRLLRALAPDIAWRLDGSVRLTLAR